MEITHIFYIVLNAILFLRAWLDTRLLRHLGKKSWKIKTVSVSKLYNERTSLEPHPQGKNVDHTYNQREPSGLALGFWFLICMEN